MVVLFADISKMALYLPGLAASLSKPEKLQVQQAMSVFQKSPTSYQKLRRSTKSI